MWSQLTHSPSPVTKLAFSTWIAEAVERLSISDPPVSPEVQNFAFVTKSSCKLLVTATFVFQPSLGFCYFILHSDKVFYFHRTTNVNVNTPDLKTVAADCTIRQESESLSQGSSSTHTVLRRVVATTTVHHWQKNGRNLIQLFQSYVHWALYCFQQSSGAPLGLVSRRTWTPRVIRN